MPLGIDRQDSDGISIITLRGKLMLGEDCVQLETLIPQLIKEGRTKLIFDLSGVTHIDSTGIGRFIDTYSRLMQIGGKMKLAAASGAVREAFRVTRLDTVFSFTATVDEARAAL